MKNAVTMILFVLMTLSTCLYAQDSLVGKYSGAYTGKSAKGGADISIGLELVIASIEGGKVKGTAVSQSKACAGEYPMAGTYEGNKLEIRSTTKGGPSGDCSLRLSLTVEGNRLIGQMGGGQPVQLSKSPCRRLTALV